eukprot:CAMPEP_0172944112 /NCGR_PEP_ID=MMETSP1075-20121228/225884_1 /TAXON_ID=2916 /ORGANISM="Ceratium fusus, Strain PA161109" /LENGTH=117 /DNA_ID=CAMNT_0013805539 /DNA_START=209 /DNA_END=565 /DNA_ORIENTATION=-
MKPCLPRGSWFTAMTSALLYVSRSCALIRAGCVPMSSGAIKIAQMLNCVRLLSCESCLAEPPEDPRSMSGSLNPPGCALLPSPAATRKAKWHVLHSTQSLDILQELASAAPPRKSVA